jgi:hypothetical protein
MTATAATLTAADHDALATLKGKELVIRDVVRGVAHGHHLGAWIWGEGGIGKSYTVVSELDKSGAAWHLTNSRMSGKGLFELLQEYPDHVHLLEDVEQMCNDKNAAGVLRSALWSVPGRPRSVTWNTGRERAEFAFNGAILFTMNMPLSDIRPLRALKTRIAHLQFAPTTAEIIARIRQQALKGYGTLDPDVALEVADFAIGESLRAGRNIDWRLVVNSWNYRRQWDAKQAESDWRELVLALLSERVTDGESNLATIAREVDAMPITYVEKLKEWRARTGKSDATFKRQRK